MNRSPCITCDNAGPRTLVFRKGSHTLVRCPSCLLVFQDPQPSDEALAEMYYDSAEFAEDLMGRFRSWTIERAREKIPFLQPLGVLNSGLRALDVGCSSGAWLEIAEEFGLAATGIELGERTVELARSRGLDVRLGTLATAETSLGDERFDLITYWDVLEHLRDPVDELRRAVRLLRPSGIIAATFPNIAGWYPRLTYALVAKRLGVWEHPQLPFHLYDFSPETARRLFTKAGCRPIVTRTYSTPFEFYRNTSLSRARLGEGRRRHVRFAFEALRTVVYPVARLFDRGNALFVAARPDHNVPGFET